ncbi:NAD(P)-dependent oxidoreductase [Candidatus Uhrbacteria bacterium]|nr:NAD(P)-dependent oxidoreductase [Candidatus Uhrbacteria bacterium]
MHILITGGAGYLGGVLVPLLLKRGHRVTVFDKMIFGDEGLKTVNEKITLIKGDVLHPPNDLMHGIDAVIHLAGVSSQAKASSRSPRYTDLSNHIATEILARQAKCDGVRRFILASSCSIYCSYRYTTTSIAPLCIETDEINAVNAYAFSKRAAEEVLFELMDSSFQPVCLRKGTLYGFSPKMRYDLVLNSFTKDAFSKRKITVSAAGELYRPMIDIHDAAAAYVSAVELPDEKVGGKNFNVVDRNWKLADLAVAFTSVLKSEKNIDIEIDIKPFDIAYSYQADNRAFCETFSYKPTGNIRNAILEIWDHLEKGHNYQDQRFYNDPWYAEALKRDLL